MRKPSRPQGPPSHGQRAASTTEETAAGKIVEEILPHLAVGIATVTADQLVVSWNLRVEQITGYTLEAINAVGFAQIFTPVAVMQHILGKAYAGTPTLNEHLRLKCADGREVSVAVQCSPLTHLDRAAGEVVVALRELAPLQAQLRRTDRFQFLGRLAGSLSHEIRNPLNAILLHADILEEEVLRPSPEHYGQMAQSLATIKAEVHRLYELVQQYLSLARLSDLPRQPEDLGALLEALVLEMREPLGARGVTLCLEGLEGLGEVALHANTFRRAMLNLLHNALEAMPQGGTLTVRGWRTASQVRLAIEDTGSGIAQEQLPLLFTPFHTTKPEGTGLGLYVVQEIIAAHGGEITVQSEPGTGTTFAVTLPLEPPAEPPPG